MSSWVKSQDVETVRQVWISEDVWEQMDYGEALRRENEEDRVGWV